MLTVLVPSLMASQTYLSSKAAIPDMPIVREIKELPVYDNMMVYMGFTIQDVVLSLESESNYRYFNHMIGVYYCTEHMHFLVYLD